MCGKSFCFIKRKFLSCFSLSFLYSFLTNVILNATKQKQIQLRGYCKKLEAELKAIGARVEERPISIFGAESRRDAERVLARTFAWFTEEVGELSRALFRGDHDERMHEFADVLAWLTTLASMHGVELSQAAAKKYASGCPRCHKVPCRCDEATRSPAPGPTAGPAAGAGPGATAPQR